MSKIIHINGIGQCRFSLLSKNKIQIEYRVPIISGNKIISDKKVKIRYIKRIISVGASVKVEQDLLNDSMNGIFNKFSIIPFKDRFINKLSMNYGIKKKNIKLQYSTSPIEFKSDNIKYEISPIFLSFVFDDKKWKRDYLLNKIL